MCLLCIVCSLALLHSRLWCRDVSLVYCVFSGLVTLAFASRLWYREVSLVYLCVLWPCYTGFCQSTLVQGGVLCVLCVLCGLVTLAFASHRGGGWRKQLGGGGGAKIESMLPFDVALPVN